MTTLPTVAQILEAKAVGGISCTIDKAPPPNANSNSAFKGAVNYHPTTLTLKGRDGVAVNYRFGITSNEVELHVLYRLISDDKKEQFASPKKPGVTTWKVQLGKTESCHGNKKKNLDFLEALYAIVDCADAEKAKQIAAGLFTKTNKTPVSPISRVYGGESKKAGQPIVGEPIKMEIAMRDNPADTTIKGIFTSVYDILKYSVVEGKVMFEKARHKGVEVSPANLADFLTTGTTIHGIDISGEVNQSGQGISLKLKATALRARYGAAVDTAGGSADADESLLAQLAALRLKAGDEPEAGPSGAADDDVDEEPIASGSVAHTAAPVYAAALPGAPAVTAATPDAAMMAAYMASIAPTQ